LNLETRKGFHLAILQPSFEEVSDDSEAVASVEVSDEESAAS
jgi:hypothetical protein